MNLTESEAVEKQLRPEPWPYWILTQGFRVIALTVLWSGIGMAAGLFCGIVVLLAVGVFQHRMPAMDLAYRQIAIPVALLSGSCALVWNLVRAVQAGFRRLSH